MKKFYSLISVVLFSAAMTFGQVAKSPVHKNHATASNSNARKFPALNGFSARHSNPQNNSAAIIWSDDFSTPGNWNISHGAGTVSDWVIGTTPPSGPFAIPVIASTTAANGFALFDSDLMCDTTNGQVGDLANVTPINCTGHTSIRLTFEESYCRYYDSTYVYVSNDGTNWTLFEVNVGLTANDYAGGGTASSGATINPVPVAVDITSVAANQATVYIRFQFYSPRAIAAGLAGCAYSWMIDDVVVEDMPSDDCAMLPSIPSEYTVIPLSQAQPIDLAAKVVNVGLSTETTVGFNAFVLVYDYASAGYLQVYNATSTVETSLNSGDTTAVLSAGPWTIPDTGFYAFVYISFMDNADADNSNDTSISFLYVSDTTYARDNAAIFGGNPDITIYYNPGGSGSFGLLYEAVTPVTVTSVTTFFFSHTVGDQLTASIHSITGGAPDVMLGSSQVFTTTDLDTGGILMTFAIDPPVTMNPGLFAASIDQLTTDPINFWMNEAVSTPSTTFFGSTGSWGLLDTIGTSQGGPPIFPQTLMIRPNLQLNTGVTENNFSSNIDVFPNPSNGKLYILNSGQKENMTVTVFNNVGQVVYTKAFSQMSNAVVDLTTQAGGVYSVQIKSAKDITTKSVVISNK